MAALVQMSVRLSFPSTLDKARDYRLGSRPVRISQTKDCFLQVDRPKLRTPELAKFDANRLAYKAEKWELGNNPMRDENEGKKAWGGGRGRAPVITA